MLPNGWLWNEKGKNNWVAFGSMYTRSIMNVSRPPRGATVAFRLLGESAPRQPVAWGRSGVLSRPWPNSWLLDESGPPWPGWPREGEARGEVRCRVIMEFAVCRRRPGLFALGRGRDISGRFRRCAVGRCKRGIWMLWFTFLGCILYNVIIHTGGPRSRFLGVPFWQRDPSQGTPKTKNSTDLGQFFGLRDPNSLPKNNINNKMSHFPPARGRKLTWTSTRP